MRICPLVLLSVVVLWAGCDPRSEPQDEALSVVSYNIWHDQGDWPARLSMIVEKLVQIEPDVVCLQEVLQHADLPNQARTIADSLGYAYYFTSVDEPERDRRYGNAILTRTSIEDSTWLALEPLNDYRNAGHVRTMIEGRPLDVYCTHLHHMPTESGSAVRSTQLRDLLDFIDTTRSTDAVVLAGDFNADPDFPEMRLLDDRFLDAYEAVHGPEPRPTTLNPYLGHSERWIDYVFQERGSPLVVRSAERILDVPGPDSLWASDHFGVLVVMEWADGDAPHSD